MDTATLLSRCQQVDTVSDVATVGLVAIAGLGLLVMLGGIIVVAASAGNRSKIRNAKELLIGSIISLLIIGIIWALLNVGILIYTKNDPTDVSLINKNWWKTKCMVQ